MRRIKVLVVFSMRPLDFPIMSRSKRLDELMLYPERFKRLLKHRCPSAAKKAVRKFTAIVGLNAQDFERKFLDQVLHKLGSRVRAIVLKAL